MQIIMVDISKFKTAQQGIEYVRSEEFQALDNATKVEQIRLIALQLPTVAPGQTVLAYSGTLPIYREPAKAGEAAGPVVLPVSKEGSMAFVNEREGIKDTKKFRTVDYSRNLVLRNTNSSFKNNVEIFELDVGDQTVKFATTITREFLEDKTGIYTYQIDAIGIPDALKERKEEIKKYIAEALDAFGHFYSRKDIRQVIVTIKRSLQKTF